MIFMSKFNKIFLCACLVITAQLLALPYSYAERYSVERDSFGNFSAKKVEKKLVETQTIKEQEQELDPNPALTKRRKELYKRW